MAKSLPGPYHPAPVPYEAADLPRYLEEELNRIAERFKTQPVAMTTSEMATITVTTSENWQRLFDVGVAPDWEVPSGGFDSATGEYPVPVNGLYQHMVDLRVQPYGSGNKIYAAGVRLIRVNVDGSPDNVIEAIDSGADDFPLGVTLPVQAPAIQGDIFYCEATVVHEQFVGAATVEASWQLNRVSAA